MYLIYKYNLICSLFLFRKIWKLLMNNFKNQMRYEVKIMFGIILFFAPTIKSY